MESLHSSPTSNSDTGIYDEYFKLTNEYKTKYGPKLKSVIIFFG